MQYIPGIRNVKADPLSRNKSAAAKQPECELENKIYVVTQRRIRLLSKRPEFMAQMQEAQDSDIVVDVAKRAVEAGEMVQGRLKRVRKQLRVENGLLKKSGWPVVPTSLRNLFYLRFTTSLTLALTKLTRSSRIDFIGRICIVV